MIHTEMNASHSSFRLKKLNLINLKFSQKNLFPKQYCLIKNKNLKLKFKLFTVYVALKAHLSET